MPQKRKPNVTHRVGVIIVVVVVVVVVVVRVEVVWALVHSTQVAAVVHATADGVERVVDVGRFAQQAGGCVVARDAPVVC